MTRRDFLRGSLVASSALAMPMVIPSQVLGKDGAVAPSERIMLGGIGLGPRGQYDFIAGHNVALCNDPAVRQTRLFSST